MSRQGLLSLLSLRKTLGTATAFALLGTTACHFGDPLSVVSSTPSGELQGVPSFLEIHFLQPIIDAEATEPVAKGLDLDIEPKVAGSVSYPTPDSLAFTFAEPLKPAQRYRVTLESGLRSADGKAVLKDDLVLEFVTAKNKGVRLGRLGPAAEGEKFPERGEPGLTNLALDDRLVAELRYPAEVASLKSLVRVLGKPMAGGASQTLAATLSFPAGANADRFLVTAPAGGWPKHTHLEIVLGKGLGVALANAGAEKSAEDQTLQASTYGPFKVVQGPECDMCRPPPTLRVEFSTPVSCENVIAGIRLEPAGDALRCAGNDVDTNIRIEPVPSLGAYRTYRLHIGGRGPALTDHFGQTLSEPTTFTIATGDTNPRFAHQLMFNVLERTLTPSHEEKVWDSANLEVTGKRLAFADAWQVIQKEGLGDQVAWQSLPWWLSDDYGEYYYEDSCYFDEELGEEVCNGRSDRRHPGAVEGSELDIPGGVTKKLDAKNPEADDGEKAWATVPVPLEPYLEGKGGIVVLKATPLGKDGARLSSPVVRLLNVTDIGLSAKYSPNRLIVLAASLASGKPVAGATVKVFPVDKNAQKPLGDAIATSSTDANGIATFTAAQLTVSGAEPNLQARGLFVTASTADDEAFIWSSFEVGGRRAYGATSELVGSVYTERGVYRPGETVYFRAVLRTSAATGFATPQGKVHVRATRQDYDRYDEEEAGGDDTVYSADHDLSQWGSLHGSFVVPATARVGDYDIGVKLGEQRLSTDFKVAEFRRAEMKVGVATKKSEYLVGENLEAVINADYLFGAPAAGLAMRWSLRRAPTSFDSKRFSDARFSDSSYHTWYEDRETYSDFWDEGTETLDDTGTFRLKKKLQGLAQGGRMEAVTISATVDDASGQSVSAVTKIGVHPAALHVGIIPRGYLREVDKLFSYDVVVVTPEDEPVANTAVEVDAHQDYWYSVRRQGPGGKMTWTYEREVIDLPKSCAGTTNADGRLTCQFTPKKGGDIRLRATAKDGKGRRSSASAWFWVVGDPNYYGGRSDQNAVSLYTESPEVAAGQTAKIAISSPFAEGLALITVEREDILWQKVMPVGTNASIELPVDPSWAPNVFISAHIVRGRIPPGEGLKADANRDKPAFALGHMKLGVKPTRHELTVKVSTDAPKYEPGQKATASVSLASPDGKPWRGEVNLYAVDEGVLMLTSYRTPDIVKSMLKERSFQVLALDTRKHVLGERLYVLPSIKGEEEGGGGGADEDEGVRRDFNPVAVWVGGLETDGEGKGTTSFTLPDTVTTYRLMAVAVGEGDRFGKGETSFKVNKTLMLRQAMPRFLRPGDRAQAGVVINQLTGENQTVTVELRTVDENLFTVRGSRKVERKVGGKETGQVRFDLEAKDAEGTSKVIIAASMGNYRDAVELDLPVRRLVAREAVAVSGVLEQGELTHTLTLPDQARPVDLEVNMSGLPLASLEERLRGLIGYPYGCLEQRTSKILPLLAAQRLGDHLKLKSIPTDKIKGWVEEWVKLVPKYFCGDDGFDYYPGCGSGSDPYLTAFALDGLLTAKKFGYAVPDDLLNRPGKYLETRLARMGQAGSSWDHNASGLTGALRVLSAMGKGQASFENAVYESRQSLPLFAKADLARAIRARAGKDDPRLKTLVADIMQRGTKTGGFLRFPSETDNQYWWAWDSEQRSTAVVLRTMLEVEPTDARVPLIVKGLVSLDGEQTYYATQGVTQTLLGLAEAVEVLKDAARAPIATVEVGGKALVSQKKIAQGIETVIEPGKSLGDGPYVVKVKNAGEGPLFFGGFLHYAFPATARLPAHNAGFSVERSYTDRDGKPITGKVKVGDFVLVNVRIVAKESGRMVVIDDPLPAGLEPVDTSLDTSDKEMAEVMESGNNQYWEYWRSQYREMRDDRTEWHFRYLWETNEKWPLKLRYVARAVTPGSYYAPGTTVERMYQPENRGRAAGAELVVEAK